MIFLECVFPMKVTSVLWAAMPQRRGCVPSAPSSTSEKKRFTSCGFPKCLKGESVQSTGVGQLSLGLSLCLCGCSGISVGVHVTAVVTRSTHTGSRVLPTSVLVPCLLVIATILMLSLQQFIQKLVR